MAKTILKRIEVTAAQQAAIAAAETALGEICKAYHDENGEYPSFEVSMKVEYKTDMSGSYPWPKRVIAWFNVGGICDGGHGRSIGAALDQMFSRTEADKKREQAKRYRDAAVKADEEARELEKLQESEASV
jgi:hypothetical protein